ncbi:hypothetical protein [Psychromonas sp.]|uniref:hypothetical protein n=1 Tax=Psychromonas sp. TaxID=1884585 RepID=UPI0035629E28
MYAKIKLAKENIKLWTELEALYERELLPNPPEGLQKQIAYLVDKIKANSSKERLKILV